ncbi:MAG: hypothetical protein IJW73_00325 [Candidatus Gastranaerophilales bacterium]|nr:hypothetical protein [Candidatus Gastranaerophilales bacterium]
MLTSSLKNSFLQWYKKEYGILLKSKDDNFEISSCFDEFKEFLAQKYNLDSESSTMSMSDILSLDLSSQMQDGINENAEFGLDSVLLDLFEDDEMMSLIDSDSDSQLNNDEIFAFIESVRHIDGNYTDLSLDDIFAGIQMLEVEQDLILQPEEELNTRKSNSRSRSSSSSSSDKKEDTNDITKMSDEKLAQEISSRNVTFQNNKAKFDGLVAGSDDKLSELKQKMDNDYKLYQEQLKLVDNSLANELDNSVQNVNSQQKLADDSDLKLTNHQILISNLTTQYDGVLSRLNSLLQVQSGLNLTDLSQMEANEIDDIEQKKKNVEAQITQARNEEAKLKSEKESAISQLSTLEQEKTSNFELLNEYKTKRDELEQSISSQQPQLNTYYENYINSKNAYYEYKTTQTDKARQDTLSSNEKLNEANKVQNERKIKEEIKALSPSPLSQYDEEWGRIISEAAKKYASEGHSTSCGASVRKVLESLGYDYIKRCKGKEWAVENMENSPDFVEVEFSLEDIKAGNVPIGSVACFSEYDGFGYGDGKSGHVAIVIDNNGTIAEASGYIRKAGINTNIIELGHGSVRIFVPIKRPD